MHRKVILASLVVMLASAVLAFSLPSQSHDTVRLQVEVRSHFAHAPVVMLGDSIAFEAATPTLCGAAMFNGAVPGSRLADLAADGAGVVERVNPRTVVIAIGINDVMRPHGYDFAAWKRSYTQLVDGLAGRELVLVEINPVDLKGPLVAGEFNGTQITTANAFIRELADARGLKRVPAPEAIPTRDGLHPSPAGQDMWRARLMETACADRT